MRKKTSRFNCNYHGNRTVKKRKIRKENQRKLQFLYSLLAILGIQTVSTLFFLMRTVFVKFCFTSLLKIPVLKTIFPPALFNLCRWSLSRTSVFVLLTNQPFRCGVFGATSHSTETFPLHQGQNFCCPLMKTGSLPSLPIYQNQLRNEDECGADRAALMPTVLPRPGDR